LALVLQYGCFYIAQRPKKVHYLVIIDQGKGGRWRAYAPDLPGLGVAGETREEAA
jgi:hypothetical protein